MRPRPAVKVAAAVSAGLSAGLALAGKPPPIVLRPYVPPHFEDEPPFLPSAAKVVEVRPQNDDPDAMAAPRLSLAGIATMAKKPAEV